MSRFAHPSEFSVSDVGIGIMSLDFMSTITRMALCPCASGRCVIMSTEMFSQFLAGTGLGCSGAARACLSISLADGTPFDVVYDIVPKGAPVVRALHFFDGFSLSRVTC